MATIEELEHRVARLESLYDDVLKEKLAFISQRLDQLYEKTERDKTEMLAKLYEKIAGLYEKTERDKKELIKWMIILPISFSAVIITAIWAMLSFALKH